MEADAPKRGQASAKHAAPARGAGADSATAAEGEAKAGGSPKYD
jgi:hypothetical protein